MSYNGKGVGLATERSRVRLPASRFNVTTLGKLFTRLSPNSKFGTGQGTVMHCGWKGNRRSGVALVMHHSLQWLIHPLGTRPTEGR